jgi:tRNA (cytosine38-C5)-methyltransferase
VNNHLFYISIKNTNQGKKKMNKGQKTTSGMTTREPTSNNDDVITYIEFYSGVGGWGMALNDAFSRSMKFQNNNNKCLKRLAGFDHSDLCIRVFEHNFGLAMDTKSNKTFVIEKLTLKQVEDWAATIYVMSPPCQPHKRQCSNQDQDLKDPRSARF